MFCLANDDDDEQNDEIFFDYKFDWKNELYPFDKVTEKIYDTV